MENKNQDRKPALLVVDVQNGVVSGAHNRGAVIANINTLITKARSKGIPVIWVQHFDKHMPVGSFAWEVVPELIIESGDQRINKRFNSAFEETNRKSLSFWLVVCKPTVIRASPASGKRQPTIGDDGAV